LDAVIETQSNALIEKQKRLEVLKKKYASGCEARRQLYSNKSPDEEERCLNKAVADAEEVEKKARVLHNDLLQKLNNATTRVESLKRRIGLRDPELKKSGSWNLEELLNQLGLRTKNRFLGGQAKVLI